jgi:hypothetical protein
MAACAKRQAHHEDTSMNIELSRKKLDLSSAIAEGDIRVLLMVLVHMTCAGWNHATGRSATSA